MTAAFRAYAPPGPVAARFLASDARVRAIMGPVGSGKTGACLMNCLYVARAQAPDAEGVRRTRFACIRKTYRDLERTLIRSWLRWVPKEMGEWAGGTGGQPAVHRLRFALADGTTVATEILFAAIGENASEEFMRGFEVTGFYLNEADHLDAEVLTHARSRAGRYPEVDVATGFMGATWRGVWLDFNAPDTEHWIYRAFIEALPAEWRFFRQPGAFEAGAENLANLPGGYYDELRGGPEWWVRRFLHNQFGYSRDGKPVYPEFSERLHLAPQRLLPVKGLPLLLGIDGGRTPAAVFEQELPTGQRRTIAELVTEGMGATNFGRHLRKFVGAEFPGFRCRGFGDPAASWAARDDAEERSWLEIVAHESGIPLRPAPSNDPTIRLEAVRRDLVELIDGEPAYLCSPAAATLVKGFLSGYRYRRLRSAEGGRYDDRPDKNEYSHVHDAKQYVTLGDGGHLAALGRDGSRFAAPIQAPTDFKVF